MVSKFFLEKGAFKKKAVKIKGYLEVRFISKKKAMERRKKPNS